MAAMAVNKYPLASSKSARERGKRHAGKRHGAGEQDRRDADHGEGCPAIAAGCRHGRKEDVALVTHCRLRQTGSDCAMAMVSKTEQRTDAAGHPGGRWNRCPRGYASVTPGGINSRLRCLAGNPTDG